MTDRRFSCVSQGVTSPMVAAYLASASDHGDEEESHSSSVATATAAATDVASRFAKQASPSSSPSPPAPVVAGEQTPTSTNTNASGATSRGTNPKTKLSTSEELRTQICSNKYCQCIRRDGKMHRVQDLVRSRLKEHIAKKKKQQQENLEAQARDFLASLDKPLIATIRPVKSIPEGQTTNKFEAKVILPQAPTVTNGATARATPTVALPRGNTTPPNATTAVPLTHSNHIAYQQAVQQAVKRLDQKAWKVNATFARKTRHTDAAWDYQQRDTSKTKYPTATEPPPQKRMRTTTTVPRTIQTTPAALLHSKRGSFRYRRPSELTVASELTAQSVVAISEQQVSAAKPMHTLTDEEEAAIVSLATATGNSAPRWSARASLPSVRFSAAATQRNY